MPGGFDLPINTSVSDIMERFDSNDRRGGQQPSRGETPWREGKKRKKLWLLLWLMGPEVGCAGGRRGAQQPSRRHSGRWAALGCFAGCLAGCSQGAHRPALASYCRQNPLLSLV